MRFFADLLQVKERLDASSPALREIHGESWAEVGASSLGLLIMDRSGTGEGRKLASCLGANLEKAGSFQFQAWPGLTLALVTFPPRPERVEPEAWITGRRGAGIALLLEGSDTETWSDLEPYLRDLNCLRIRKDEIRSRNPPDLVVDFAAALHALEAGRPSQLVKSGYPTFSDWLMDLANRHQEQEGEPIARLLSNLNAGFQHPARESRDAMAILARIVGLQGFLAGGTGWVLGGDATQEDRDLVLHSLLRENGHQVHGLPSANGILPCLEFVSARFPGKRVFHDLDLRGTSLDVTTQVMLDGGHCTFDRVILRGNGCILDGTLAGIQTTKVERQGESSLVRPQAKPWEGPTGGPIAIPDAPSLEAAIAEAVRESLATARILRGKVMDVVDGMERLAVRIQGKAEMTAPFNAWAREQKVDAEAFFSRQEEQLTYFNIVLFGRTGAGKSTLIEALTGGDGKSISEGESDWTKGVAPREWKACRVWDTPGFNGPSFQRGELEKRAQEAVSVADIALVCFDSQSQQAMEFGKVAEWVAQFGKPAVAVLNVRGKLWRRPDKVPQGSGRRNTSVDVHMHARNIRQSLPQAGFRDIPILAISSNMAVMARGAQPFRGPSWADRSNQKVAQPDLDRWSNLPRLESLLVEALQTDAVGLRLGKLRKESAGLLDQLRTHLKDVARESASKAEVVEAAVEKTFRLLGYPRQGSLGRESLDAASPNLLGRLEALRGTPFQAQVKGTYLAFLEREAKSALAPLRLKAMRAGEERIFEAFAEGVNLGSSELEDLCIPRPAIEKACDGAWSAALDQLRSGLSLVADEASLDLRIRAAAGFKTQGDAGSGWKWAGRTGKAAGVLSSVAGAVAMTNWWNPGGWVAAGLWVGGILGSWLGGKGLEAGERKRLHARSQALKDFRTWVDETYDGIASQVQENGRESLLKGYRAMAHSVSEALSLRELQHGIEGPKGLVEQIGRLQLRDLGGTDPQRILDRAMRRIEAAAEVPPFVRAEDWVWLGDDWFGEAGEPDAPSPSGNPFPDAYAKGMEAELDRALERMFKQDIAEAARAWHARIDMDLRRNPRALPVLAELRALALDGRPRINLIGTYNAGKTSFIRRLLSCSGQALPEGLEVRANPTTSEIREIEWEGMLLVDTPGFSSLREGDSRRAVAALPDASLVLHLFQPTLVALDPGTTVACLQGDREQGIAPKAPRTLLVLNRIDELAGDPSDDPEVFMNLVRRKREELRLVLAAQGIEIGDIQICCMASDPFGLHGESSRALGAETWDGFQPFLAAFRRHSDRLRAQGPSWSLIEGGLARLKALELEVQGEAKDAQDALAFAEVVAMDLEDALSRGKRIRNERETALEKVVQDYIALLLEEINQAAEASLLRPVAERCQAWWDADDFQSRIEAWHSALCADLEAVNGELGELLKRRATFRIQAQTGGQLADSVPMPSHVVGKVGKFGALLEGKAASLTESLGKLLKIKFKPWGKIKLANKFKILGKALAWAGVALDIFSWWHEEAEIKKLEDCRTKLRTWLHESSKQVQASLVESEGEEGSLFQAFNDWLTSIETLKAENSGLIAEAREDILRLESETATYRQAAEAARVLIGI